MKKIITLLLQKPTLFSILASAIILIALPYGLYALTLEGMDKLGGAYLLFGVFIAFLILLADRAIINIIAQRTLNFIELIILVAGIIVYSYSGRKIMIDIQQNPSNYFVLIEDNGNFQESELSYSLPFDKRIIHTGNHAVINPIYKNLNRIKLIPPEDWKSYTISTREVKDLDIEFYSNYDHKFEDNEIDSLIRIEIISAQQR